MWVSTPSKYQPSNSSILLALLCCFPGYFSQDCSPIHDFSCCLLAQSRGFPFPTLLSEPISIESQPVCHREELPLPAEISVPQPWSHCSAWAFSERSQQMWMKKIYQAGNFTPEAALPAFEERIPSNSASVLWIHDHKKRRHNSKQGIGFSWRGILEGLWQVTKIQQRR